MINITPHTTTVRYNQPITFRAKIPRALKSSPCDKLELKSTKKATAIALGSIIAGLLANAKNNDINFSKCLEFKDSNDLDSYKQNLIKWMKSNGYNEYNEKGYFDLFEDMQYASSQEDIQSDIDAFISRVMLEQMYLMDDKNLNLREIIEKQEFSKELDDYILKKKIKTGNKLVPLLELSATKDKDNEVLKIKQELTQKYGIEKFCCNNDLEFAKACKKVFPILEKNNIKIPRMIFANDNVDFGGYSAITSQGNAIVINKNKIEMQDMSLEHVIAHEILHTTQPETLAFATKVIPPEMKKTADNVSEYAKDNFAVEVHCELYVKKLFSGLTEDEEKLFNYLGGTFK